MIKIQVPEYSTNKTKLNSFKYDPMFYTHKSQKPHLFYNVPFDESTMILYLLNSELFVELQLLDSGGATRIDLSRRGMA